MADLLAGSVAGDRIGQSACAELGAAEGVEDEAVGRLDACTAAVGEAQFDGRDVARTCPSQIPVGPPPEKLIAEWLAASVLQPTISPLACLFWYQRTYMHLPPFEEAPV